MYTCGMCGRAGGVATIRWIEAVVVARVEPQQSVGIGRDEAAVRSRVTTGRAVRERSWLDRHEVRQQRVMML